MQKLNILGSHLEIIQVAVEKLAAYMEALQHRNHVGERVDLDSYWSVDAAFA